MNRNGSGGDSILDQFNGSVGRAAIDNDDLIRKSRLRQESSKPLVNRRGFIEHRCDN